MNDSCRQFYRLNINLPKTTRSDVHDSNMVLWQQEGILPQQNQYLHFDSRLQTHLYRFVKNVKKTKNKTKHLFVDRRYMIMPTGESPNRS